MIFCIFKNIFKEEEEEAMVFASESKIHLYLLIIGMSFLYHHIKLHMKDYTLLNKHRYQKARREFLNTNLAKVSTQKLLPFYFKPSFVSRLLFFILLTKAVPIFNTTANLRSGQYTAYPDGLLLLSLSLSLSLSFSHTYTHRPSVIHFLS